MTAFSRVEFGIVGRTRGGGRSGSAVAASADNLCGRLQHGQVRFDFRRKAAEHIGHAVLLPAGAPAALADPGALWRAAEAAERRADAQVARQVLLSIPREVRPEDRLAFATAVAAPWVADGAAVQVDVHCPRATDQGEQPHAHFILTLRRVTDAGLAPTKAREWNQQFREDSGRAERGRIEARANTWLAAHGIEARIDMRSLADQGDDRPPEPTAPRADWQRWIREGGHPDAAPITVASALTHRIRRTALAAAITQADAAAAEAIALTARITTAAMPPPPQERPMLPRPLTASRRTTATARRTPQEEPWMRRAGGLDALPDKQREAARASYARWTAGHPDRARRHALADYVEYVQDQRAGDTVPRDAVVTAGGVAAASATVREDRRRVHLAALLADRYEQPSEVAALVHRVTLDTDARTATLHLSDGSRLIDHGDRIEHAGAMTAQAAEATAATAAAHGWRRVTLTGSTDYRDAVSSACALRTPPVATDHTLSRAAAERVANALRARAMATIPPLDEDEIRRTAATDPAVAARQVLDHAEARARAALTGRPTGSTDPSELARSRIAELIARREQTRADATEATEAATAHRAAHPWTIRIIDPAVRRRQAALDGEAARLDSAARSLDRGHDRAVRHVERDARREATATATAVEDWRWSSPVRQAERQVAAVIATRAAVSGGDLDTIAAAARGDVAHSDEISR